MDSPLIDKRAVILHEIQTLAKKANMDESALLFNAGQVALLFGVSERTIRIWANKNWIPAIHTPSGHWKFPALKIAHLYEMSLQQGQLLFDKNSKQMNNGPEILPSDEQG